MFHISLKKKYGQNFLIDDNIIHKIISSSNITKDDFVLEIGPGIGTMTQYLCESAKNVVCVEIDHTLIPALRYTLSGYDNVSVINEDILKINIIDLVKDSDGPINIIANLPYYITTPILLYIFENKISFSKMTIMVQKEVAERMQASPGSKEYGALSLVVQYYCDTQIVANVSPSCFLPNPKVGSSVICLKKSSINNDVYDETLLFQIIRASFNQRRKTLANSLSSSPIFSVPKNLIIDCISKMGFKENVRGEELSLNDFKNLTNLIFLSST